MVADYFPKTVVITSAFTLAVLQCDLASHPPPRTGAGAKCDLVNDRRK